MAAAASHLRDVMQLREYERAEFRARSKVT